MKTNVRRLWALSSAPIDTWSSWAVTSLLCALGIALVSWYYNDFGSYVVSCIGASIGVGVMATLNVFTKKKRPGTPR